MNWFYWLSVSVGRLAQSPSLTASFTMLNPHKGRSYWKRGWILLLNIGESVSRWIIKPPKCRNNPAKTTHTHTKQTNQRSQKHDKAYSRKREKIDEAAHATQSRQEICTHNSHKAEDVEHPTTAIVTDPHSHSYKLHQPKARRTDRDGENNKQTKQRRNWKKDTRIWREKITHFNKFKSTIQEDGEDTPRIPY